MNQSNAALMNSTFDQSSTAESDSHVHSSNPEDADVTMCICPVCGFSASSPRGQDEHMELVHGEANSPFDKVGDPRPKSYTIQSSPDDCVIKLSVQASSTPHHPSRWSTLRNVVQCTEKIVPNSEPGLTMNSQLFTSAGSDPVVRSQSTRQKTYSCPPGSTDVKMKKVDSRRRYRCNICPATFPWHGDLTEHLRLAHGMQKARENARSGKAGSFYCSHCKYVAKYQSELKRHMRLHWGVKPFICVFCPYRSAWKGDLKRHMESHHRERFSDETELIKIMSQFKNNAGTMINGALNQAVPHPNQAHDSRDDDDGDGDNDGDLDAYSFSKDSDTSLPGLGEDRKSVDEDLSVVRSMIRSRRAERVKRDFSPTQPSLTPATVSNCSGQSEGGSSDGRSGSVKHSKSSESDHRLTCEICTYKAQNQSKFMNHMASHINARQFQCPICDQRSNYKWDIRKHLKKHHPDLSHMPIRTLYDESIITEDKLHPTGSESTDMSNPATVLLFAAAAAAAVAAAAAGATPSSAQPSLTNRPNETYSTAGFTANKVISNAYPPTSIFSLANNPSNSDISPMCLVSTSSSSPSYPSSSGLHFDSNLDVNHATSPLSPGAPTSRLWSDHSVMTKTAMDSQNDSAMPIDLSKGVDYSNKTAVVRTTIDKTDNQWSDSGQYPSNLSSSLSPTTHSKTTFVSMHHPLSKSAFSSLVYPPATLAPSVQTMVTNPLSNCSSQPINLTTSCLPSSCQRLQKSLPPVSANHNNGSSHASATSLLENNSPNSLFLNLHNHNHQQHYQQQQQQLVFNSLVQSWQQQKALFGPNTTNPASILFSNRGLSNPLITIPDTNSNTAGTYCTTIANSLSTSSSVAATGTDFNDYLKNSWEQGRLGVAPRSTTNTPCMSTNRSDANSTPNQWSPSVQNSDWIQSNDNPTNSTSQIKERLVARRRSHLRGRKSGPQPSYTRTVGLSSSVPTKEEQWKRHQCSGCGHRSNWKWDINKHIKVAHPERTNITTVTLDLEEAKRTFGEYMNRVKLSRNRYLNEPVNDSFNPTTGPWSGSCATGTVGPYGPVGEGYYRPYKCSVCGHRSNWKWDVRKHIKQMHNGAAEIITLSLEEARRTIHQYKNRRRNQQHRHLIETLDNKPDLVYSSSESNNPSPSTPNLGRDHNGTTWSLPSESKTQYTSAPEDDGDDECDDTNSINQVQSSPLNLVIASKSPDPNAMPQLQSNSLADCDFSRTSYPELKTTITAHLPKSLPKTRSKSCSSNKLLFTFKCRLCKHRLGSLKSLFIHLVQRHRHRYQQQRQHSQYHTDYSNSLSSNYRQFRIMRHSYSRSQLMWAKLSKLDHLKCGPKQPSKWFDNENHETDDWDTAAATETLTVSGSDPIPKNACLNSDTDSNNEDRGIHSQEFIPTQPITFEDPVVESRFVTKNLIECERRLSRLVSTSTSSVFTRNLENAAMLGPGTRPLVPRGLTTNQMHSSPLKSKASMLELGRNQNSLTEDKFGNPVHHLAQLLDEVMGFLKPPNPSEWSDERRDPARTLTMTPTTASLMSTIPGTTTTTTTNKNVMHYLTDMIHETVSKNENINYSDSFNCSGSSNEENQDVAGPFSSKSNSIYNSSQNSSTVQQILQHPDIQNRFLTLATLLHHVSGCCTKSNSPA